MTVRFHSGQDFHPPVLQPIRHEVKAWLAFAGYGIAPRTGTRRLSRPGCTGPDCPGPRPRARRKRSPKPVRRRRHQRPRVSHRKALVAQEKGAVGILFVADVHNHPEPQNFEALARAAWPEKRPRMERYALQDWVERVRIPAAQISVATARALLGNTKSSLEELGQASEKPSSASAFPIDESVVSPDDGCQPPCRARPKRRGRPGG